jgi:hypothetical protein
LKRKRYTLGSFELYFENLKKFKRKEGFRVIADIIMLIVGLIARSKILVIFVVLDLSIWIITYKLTMEWLDYVYVVKTNYNYEVEFGRMVIGGFSLWIPGIILLIGQICTKSFRNYIQSMKNKSLKTLLFR